jgi:hypothetical protein
METGLIELDSAEAITPSQVEAIERATVDVQIATAHKFPRSMDRFKTRAIDMVQADRATAEACIYCRPVGKKKNGEVEYAEGLSIRTAEIVGACYGNLRVGAVVVEQTPRYVKARGYAHDLESNFATACEVIESTVTKDGNPYSERMRIVIAKAAVAKARRDATFQVVPRALCTPIEDAARRVAIGDTKTIEERRAAVERWIEELGIDESRVWRALGITGLGDVGLREMKILAGLKTAIAEGMSTDEAFPPAETPTPGRTRDAKGQSRSMTQKEKLIAHARALDIEIPAGSTAAWLKEAIAAAQQNAPRPPRTATRAASEATKRKKQRDKADGAPEPPENAPEPAPETWDKARAAIAACEADMPKGPVRRARKEAGINGDDDLDAADLDHLLSYWRLLRAAK